MSKMIITSGGGKKVNAQYGGFTIETDQSVMGGGEGSAPEPFALFLAALGTCAGIYVYSFCQKRDIPTESIRIVQTQHRREDGKGIGRISLEIEVPQDFPEKYRNALAEAASLCAVKKTIQDPPTFDITTKVTESQP